MNPLATMFVDGNFHFVLLPALSVRYQPPRLMLVWVKFCNSTQSPYWLSSSLSVWPLLAMNSLIRTSVAAKEEAARTQRRVRSKCFLTIVFHGPWVLGEA